jgi:hypothetical protein
MVFGRVLVLFLVYSVHVGCIRMYCRLSGKLMEARSSASADCIASKDSYRVQDDEYYSLPRPGVPGWEME